MLKYIQGEKKEFTIQLLKKDDQGVSRPFDLTSNTEITVVWKAGTSVIKKNRVAATTGVVVVGASVEGKIKATLLPADTETQPKSASGLIEIAVTFSATDIKKFQVKGAFSVEEKAG